MCNRVHKPFRILVLDQRSSYRQILKSTFLFGGVQIFTILFTIIRTKIIALTLGTVGVGINGLLTAPLNLISSITGLGIAFSAIRDISEASGTEDETKITKIIITLKRWISFTGFLGMGITLICSYWLSKWTFGNREYWGAFAFLSTSLYINAISGGQRAIMQGMRELQNLAKANVLGSFISLVFTIPLYFILGLNGIVPAIIISAIIVLIISWIYSTKVNIQKISLTYIESIRIGFNMVKLGIVLTISNIIGELVRYIINSYISRNGGADQVGLYQAGFAMISRYLGLIFVAMGADYFPKLAAINKDNEKCTEIINHQITVCITIIAPLGSFLLTFFPICIKILYSGQFLNVIPMGQWLILSTFLKTIVWACGFLFLAKGAYKISFIVDNLINLVFVFGYIGFYQIWGLEGLGIADFVLYSLAFPLSFFIAKVLYNFHLKKETIYTITIFGALLLLNFIISKYFNRTLLYLLGTIISCSMLIIAFYKVNSQTEFIKYAKTKLFS